MKKFILCSFAVAAMFVGDFASAKDPIEAKLRPGGNYMDNLRAQTNRSYSSSRSSSSRYAPRYTSPSYSSPANIARRAPVMQSNQAIVRQSYSYPSQFIGAPTVGSSSVVVSQPCVPYTQPAPVISSPQSAAVNRVENQVPTSIQSNASQGATN